jgi:hypothetical protein
MLPDVVVRRDRLSQRKVTDNSGVTSWGWACSFADGESFEDSVQRGYMFPQLLSDQLGVKYEAIDGFLQTSDERAIFARAVSGDG